MRVSIGQWVTELAHGGIFPEMAAFALLASVGLACFAPGPFRMRVNYSLWCVALFLGIGLGVAWLMYPWSR
jgi:hypothetical protein